MVRVSTAISSCTRSQVTRSRKPIRPRAKPAIGTKARPISPMTRSVVSIMYAAKPSSSSSETSCITPFWMNTRAPSRSSMPRVTRSPEWMRS